MSISATRSDLSGNTVEYGGVRFDGSGNSVLSGTAIRSTPPQFDENIQAQYDDSGINVVSYKVQLQLECVIFSETNGLQETQLRKLRETLLRPRLALVLTGCGLGFDVASSDIDWGPRPLSCSIRPIGNIAAKLSWSIVFNIPPCAISQAAFGERLKSFSFSQSFNVNDEGLTTLTTSGYWEIAPQLGNGQFQLADKFRDKVNVSVPSGFRRMQQDYQQSQDGTRMDFVVVDQQLSGDALPEYIIDGNGSFSLGTAGPGLSHGVMTLEATLTVAPGIPPGFSALQFFLMAQQKVQDYIEASDGKATVFPVSLSVERGLWSRSRTTRFAIQWSIQKCISSFLSAGFWTPLENSGDWQKWSQSISYLWNQRGTAQLYSNPNNNNQVNFCNSTGQIVIETPQKSLEDEEGAEDFGIACESVDPERSWIYYDVEVKLLTKSNKIFHRRAVDANRTTPVIEDDLYGVDGIQVAESYDMTGKADLVEESGGPTQYVLLKAAGLRLQHMPVFPVLKEIDGQKLEYVDSLPVVKQAFDVGCPVWQMQGWTLYRVVGAISKFDVKKPNPTICGSEEEQDGHHVLPD